MDVLVERCAGLDVHKDTVVACVRTPDPEGRRTQETETFGATTAELLALSLDPRSRNLPESVSGDRPVSGTGTEGGGHPTRGRGDRACRSRPGAGPG
jgi:hypothetical protein